MFLHDWRLAADSAVERAKPAESKNAFLLGLIGNLAWATAVFIPVVGEGVMLGSALAGVVLTYGGAILSSSATKIANNPPDAAGMLKQVISDAHGAAERKMKDLIPLYIAELRQLKTESHKLRDLMNDVNRRQSYLWAEMFPRIPFAPKGTERQALLEKLMLLQVQSVYADFNREYKKWQRLCDPFNKAAFSVSRTFNWYCKEFRWTPKFKV